MRAKDLRIPLAEHFQLTEEEMKRGIFLEMAKYSLIAFHGLCRIFSLQGLWGKPKKMIITINVKVDFYCCFYILLSIFAKI